MMQTWKTNRSRQSLGAVSAFCFILLLLVVRASAEQSEYSKSAEYKSMIDEIHNAAPSPAFIATGKRPTAEDHLDVTVAEDDRTLTLRTKTAAFVLDKTRGTLTAVNANTKASWSLSLSSTASCIGDSSATAGLPSARVGAITRASKSWSIALQTPCGRTSFKLDLLTTGLARLTLGDTNSSPPRAVQLHFDGGGPFFGLGERFWQAGLSGTTLDVRPQDRYGEPGHNWTYVAIPFVYGPTGLGMYADTAFDTNFRFNQADTSFDLKIADSPVSIYLFVEETPKAVLSAYTDITGRPQDPPQWTFGPWITSLQGKGPVLDVAHRIRTEGMPASALWIYDQNDEAANLGWPFWFASYYGDPRAFVDTLHGQGFKVLTYVHPYIRAATLPYATPNTVYQSGVSDKLLVMGADGKPAGPRFEQVPVGNIDFTNPPAVDLWQKMITTAVRDQGFDGWMEDFGEWVRDTDRFACGSGRTLSELYPLLYHKITLRIAQAINPAVVPFSRSGSPGSQQFSPVLWGADQSPNWSRDFGLPSVVTAGITAGMSGYSTWGPDILSTGDNRDLWMRWVEFGALTPVMRDHVWDKPAHSINVWSDADATAHFRRWAAFHSSLLPYFTKYAEEAHRTGIPIMRHTVLEFPDDPRSATAEYQYLLGRELLVAPVVQGGATLRTLYLPRGEWVSFWNGDFFTGGQDITVPTSPSDIPILVRAGSILPFKPEEEAGRWDWDDPNLLTTSLIWKAYPSQTGLVDTTFTLTNGTSAHFVQRESEVIIDGKSKTVRDYEVILRMTQAPERLQLNGTIFAQFTKVSADKQASQWWWNPSSFELHAVFHAADFHLEVEGVLPTAYQN